MGEGFFARLSPGERLGELLFGLIMTLTFTLGAGLLVGTGEGASRELLLATIGCNVAWGIIDAALLLLDRLFERGRLARIGRAIAQTSDDEHAIRLVAAELDPVLGSIASASDRRTLYSAVVSRLKAAPRRAPRLGWADLVAAAAVFVLVFFASVPATLPYLVIDDPWEALRASNLLLIGLMFAIGYRWAGYTSFRPLNVAVVLTAAGVGMVVVAIVLGG